MTVSHLSLVKGHGTENDFILIPDLDGELDLGPALVRALCDRRAGVGADGVLRVVRASAFDQDGAPSDAGPGGHVQDGAAPEFFMDYRNADGSLAEMCGNGVRVFLRYLIEQKLVGCGPAGTGPVRVGTRGGVRTAWTESDDQITVDLGRPSLPGRPPVVTAEAWTSGRPGVPVDLPNPHVVVELAHEEELTALDLRVAPAVEPLRPGGQNVEFFLRRGPRHIAMRVHERGAGETRSCGTGIAAAAVVAMGRSDDGAWRVDVPGGTCTVRVVDGGAVLLTGPAVIVGRMELDRKWLAARL